VIVLNCVKCIQNFCYPMVEDATCRTGCRIQVVLR
jgi:hypothetical protein